MVKKLTSVLLIILLLGTTTILPFGLNSSCFVYADGNQNEVQTNLSDTEKLRQGLTVYLNSRYGYLTGPVQGIERVMDSWVTSYDYWKNTPYGSAAAVAAEIIVKYRPFQISLKGTAIKAFNDLFNYLKDNGYFPNLEESTNGISSDNVYDGYLYNNSLFYTFNANTSNQKTVLFQVEKSDIRLGNSVSGITGEQIYNSFKSTGNNSNLDWTEAPAYTGITRGDTYDLVVNYASDLSYTFSFRYNSSSDYSSYSPMCGYQNFGAATSLATVNWISRIAYCNRVYNIRGNPGRFVVKFDGGINKTRYGWISYNYANGKYYIRTIGDFSSSQNNSFTNESVNFVTDGFIETEPDPADDSRIDYIPVDKNSGATYNTYNEYINNYKTKNTTIRNEISDDPNTGGGSGNNPSVPSGGSGSMTPDGNGGYTFNLPDVGIPDFSNFNFNISGLSQKFPFSIPFDLMAFFTVLNAPPETPEIQASIPLGLWQWNIDWDLSQFDNLASLLRNLEFIGFCIGLILITRKLIKG